MNLKEIKLAIEFGCDVRWANDLYKVEKGKDNKYYIICSSNGYTIGLTHIDGITLNGKEEEFYIKEDVYKNNQPRMSWR